MEPVFVSAEQPTAAAETAVKLERTRELLEERHAAAAVLTGAAAVAWLTAGITNPIERGSPASPLWVVVTSETATALTTNVEHARLVEPLGRVGLPLEEAPWYEPDAMTAVAEELAGSSPERWLCDDERLAGGADDLTALRLALLASEQDRLAVVGRDAAAALETALRSWEPGERDFDIQARAIEQLERDGILGVCLFVGGDVRVERFRHPLPIGERVERLAMAVVVGERGGLHAATTRFASAGRLDGAVAAAQLAAAAIEADVLDASRTGATYGDVLDSLDRAYAAHGHAGAWRDHYQGGPIAYRQREFEIVPGQTGSRWYSTRLEEGHAVAWNPSVAGGGKSEDTFLVTPTGLRQVTETGAWPTVEVGGRLRTAVLDVETGSAA